MRKVFTTVVAISLIFTTLTACGGTKEEKALNAFLKAIVSYNYAQAATIYEEAILGNIDREKTAYSELMGMAAMVVDDYNEGKKTQAEALSLLSTIERVDIVNSDFIEDIRESLSNLVSSKSAFASGEQLFEKGLYLPAYNSYWLVEWHDTYYDQAQTKMGEAADLYVAEVLKQTDYFLAANDYANALRLLNETNNAIGLNEQIKTKITIVEGQYASYAISEAEKIVQSTQDDTAAVNILQQAINNISDTTELSRLNTAYESYMRKSVDSSVAKALKTVDDFIADSDYISALKLLDDTTIVIGYNEKINAKKTTVEGQFSNHVLNEAKKTFDSTKDYRAACGVLSQALMYAGYLPGFRQWYIMQHWNELNAPVQPKPFVTKMVFTVPFSGTL